MTDKVWEIVQNIVLDTFEDTSGRHRPDEHSERVVIDVDEILDNFGMTFVYRDIVNPKYGVGNLAYIYSRLVHPVLVGLLNTATEAGGDYLDRLCNFMQDKELANYAHDELKNQIRGLFYNTQRNIDVKTEDLLLFCVAVMEVVLDRLPEIVQAYARDSKTLPSETGGYLHIAPQCSALLIPEESPDSLLITLNYIWVMV